MISSHESDNDESNQDKVKAAFSLMGFCFSEGEPHAPALIGDVVYRKRHIRQQNRQLKLKMPFVKSARHTYYDDDGNPIVNTLDKVSFYSLYMYLCIVLNVKTKCFM